LQKWVRFFANSREQWGYLEGEVVRAVRGEPYGDGWQETGEEYVLAGLELLAPCRPTKIIGIGLNYKDHAEEMKMELPKEPVLFLKPPSSVLPPGGKIIYPDGVKRLDYEGELAVIIGKRAKNVSAADAPGFVFGYTCGNDVTARDLQAADGQWTRAKSFDTFCPLGPWIATGLDASDLALEVEVNGILKQASSTAQLAFNVAQLVAHVSKVMTLEPGDVIMTGTPSGVGRLQKGDTVAVRIASIGELTNTVA